VAKTVLKWRQLKNRKLCDQSSADGKAGPLGATDGGKHIYPSAASTAKRQRLCRSLAGAPDTIITIDDSDPGRNFH
jgi:hypothetical protein